MVTVWLRSNVSHATQFNFTPGLEYDRDVWNSSFVLALLLQQTNSKLSLSSSCWSKVHAAFRSCLSLTLKSHSQLSIHEMKFWQQLFDPAVLLCVNTSTTPGLNTPRIIILNIVETRMWSMLMGFRKTLSNILVTCWIFDNFFWLDP